MSVLIKGMRMPENCDVCRFGDWSNLHQTASCKLKDYEPCFSDYSREFETQISTICPLAALPEKHGRLIDADALNKKAEERSEKRGELVNVLDKVLCSFDIQTAPTIIPAEEA